MRRPTRPHKGGGFGDGWKTRGFLITKHGVTKNQFFMSGGTLAFNSIKFLDIAQGRLQAKGIAGPARSGCK